jgi:hypothetical protein
METAQWPKDLKFDQDRNRLDLFDPNRYPESPSGRQWVITARPDGSLAPALA